MTSYFSGCSRALLCNVDNAGILHVKQVSHDHCIGNSMENNRLISLGIPLEKLVHSKVLGDSHCTRTIGDHNLKYNIQSFDLYVLYIFI